MNKLINDYKWLWILLVIGFAVLPLSGVNIYWIQIFTSLGIYAVLAFSINLLAGYSGQVSLGHGGFYAVGAYTSAVLATKMGLPFIVSLPAAVIMGMVFGAILAFPAVRLKGFYLAMLTVAFGMIIENILVNFTSVTGGTIGISGIPAAVFQNLSLFGIKLGNAGFYYLVWVLVLGCALLIKNLILSHWGRAFLAVEGGEIAAASLGINVTKHKYLAFILSAGMASLAGSLYAHMVGYLSPEAFTFHVSTLIITMALVGGMQTNGGPLVGAAIFTFLPQYLHVFKENQGLVYGLILLLSYALLPKGLVGTLIKRRPLLKKGKLDTRDDSKSVITPVFSGGNKDLLKIESVSKSFGGNRALQGVTVELQAGKIHALIGPNGSGKTTLVNIISGIYRPDEGRLKFDDKYIEGLPPHVLAGLGIARTFQNLKIYPEMTVLENVVLGAQTQFKAGLINSVLNLPSGVREELELVESAREILDSLGLKHLEDHYAGELPYGTQKMLEVARAMLSRPKLLLLDEPAAGLNADEIAHLETVLHTLKNRGITILIIEHHLDFLLRIASKVIVLDFGSKIFEGTPGEARRDSKVKEVYIGGEVVNA